MKTLIQDRATPLRFPTLLRKCGPFKEAPKLGLREKPPTLDIPAPLPAVWVARGGYIEASPMVHHQLSWPVDQIGFHVFEQVECSDPQSSDGGIHRQELERIAGEAWPKASQAIDVEVFARLVLLLKQSEEMVDPARAMLLGWIAAGAAEDLSFDQVLSWEDLDVEQRRILPAGTAVPIEVGMLRTMQFGPLELKEYLEVASGFEDYWHMMGRVKIGMMCVA